MMWEQKNICVDDNTFTGNVEKRGDYIISDVQLDGDFILNDVTLVNSIIVNMSETPTVLNNVTIVDSYLIMYDYCYNSSIYSTHSNNETFDGVLVEGGKVVDNNYERRFGVMELNE